MWQPHFLLYLIPEFDRRNIIYFVFLLYVFVRHCFIILTTAPNDSVAPIHDRMPLLLSHEQVRPWLVDAGAALELLCSRPPLLLRTSCDGQLGFDDLA